MHSPEESKKVLTEVIRRQMAILGPDITLAKVKNVEGIQVDSAGNVTEVTGDTQTVLQNLINQFVELSGLIVKKTMESVIMSAGSTGVAAAAEQMGAQSGSPASQPPVSPNGPEGYSIGKKGGAAPDQKTNEENIKSANNDIEDLNKMLNNLNTTPPQNTGGNT